MKTAIAMKDEGVQKGVPDLMLAMPKLNSYPLYFGLFIEMKSATGRLTPEQKAYIQLLSEHGYGTAVCKSFDEFKHTIEMYFG